MTNRLKAFAAGPPLLGMMLALSPLSPAALAQQAGGTLRIGHFTSPASVSMLEELTAAVNRPMMAVFNNLVIFKQDELQNAPDTIVPELATGWQLERGRDRTHLRRCARASNGMTASPLPPPMSNARWICCRARAPKSCASIRANRGSTMSWR